jgi:branched-chain amino acid transport system ATP-binding protein
MAPGTEIPLLELEHVSVHFEGLRALDDVSFEVSTGEIVGLIGPNGAGKTTAFNVACGFVKPSQGHVHFPSAGKSNLRPSQLVGAGVARTLQGVGLFPHCTVLENVMAGGHLRPNGGFIASFFSLPNEVRSERALRRDAFAMLERLRIDDMAQRLPSAIPYGIAKKVSVARALMSDPSLLLLDEPASGLDEAELEDFARLVVELRSTMGVLLVEHDMEFVMPLVDRLVVLNFGHVIAHGTPADVRKNDDVIAAYLGVDE